MNLLFVPRRLSLLSLVCASAMCVSFILIYALLFSFFPVVVVVAPCRISPDSVTTLKELLIGKARVREGETDRKS